MLGDGDLADDRIPLGQKGPFEVLSASDHRFVDGSLGADDRRFGRADNNPLVFRVLIEGRGIELTEGFPFFDQGPFGDDRKNWGSAASAAFDFAFDFVVAARFDFTLFQNDMVKGPLGDLMQHRLRGAFEIASRSVHRPIVSTPTEPGDGQKAQNGSSHTPSSRPASSSGRAKKGSLVFFHDCVFA